MAQVTASAGARGASGRPDLTARPADTSQEDGSYADLSKGGGIYAYQATVKLSGTTISDNQTKHSGGGIYTINGDLDLVNSTIAKNYAGGSPEGIGGGIASQGSDVLVRQSTIANNT